MLPHYITQSYVDNGGIMLSLMNHMKSNMRSSEISGEKSMAISTPIVQWWDSERCDIGVRPTSIVLTDKIHVKQRSKLCGSDRHTYMKIAEHSEENLVDLLL